MKGIKKLNLCLLACLAIMMASCGNGSKFFGDVPAVIKEENAFANKARNSGSKSSEEMKKWYEKGQALREKRANAYRKLNGVKWNLDCGDSLKVISPLTIHFVSESRYGFSYKLTGVIEVLKDIPVRMDKYAIKSLHGRTSCGIYALAWYGKNGYPESGWVKNDSTDPIFWSQEIGSVEMKVNGDNYFIPKGTKISINSEPFGLNLSNDGEQGKCDKLCLVFSTDNRILK